MDEEKKSMLEQFAAVSGVDPERAKFYLESSAWNIETALGSFYENQEDAPAEPVEVDDAEEPKKPASMPVIGGMMDSGNSSSDEEEGQAFYAGGSEHSGQQVIGPGKKKDVVSRLFKSAREHGAEVVDPKGKTKTKKLTFMGTGYRLGEEEDDHEAVAGAASQQAEASQDVVLRMWKKGFSVDDGPLRAYDDPENSEFLKSVVRGEIPMELVRKAKGGEVFINMEDHRHEDYVVPKSSVKVFSGAGHSLGSLAPQVVIKQSADAASASASASASKDLLESKAKEDLKINLEQPTTNIQLRLPDGSRLVARMNHSHTVADIRSYVVTARPDLAAVSFAVMTTFPYAELTDDHLTLADGKLLNSALVIKKT